MRSAQTTGDPPARSTRPRVLLTEGSSCTARTVLYALAPEYDVDVLDPSPLCQCRFSRLVGKWIRCPSYSQDPAAFLDFLTGLLKTGRYDVLYPTHEEIFLVARAQDELSALTGLAVPSFEAVDCLLSKANFSRLLLELGIPQPETVIVSSRAELDRSWDFPVYVKAAMGTAGSGVRFVRNRQELDDHLRRWNSSGWFDGNMEFLVQQPAVGQHGSISVVFQRGKLLGWHSCAARRLGVGGAPMAHESTVQPQVVEHVERIGRHLDWHGGAFFDFFYDAESQRPTFIEGNPRIWQTANSVLSGVNLSQLLVRMSMNEAVAPLPVGQRGVRTHEAYLMLITKALEGANRRELMREIVQCWRRTGLYANSQDELTRIRDDWMSLIPYLAITLQLLVSPRLADRIVTKTVENYALSEDASRIIRAGFEARGECCPVSETK